MMKKENRIPGKSNCFQINKGVQAIYNDAEQKLESLTINGKPVETQNEYSICLQEYHYKNSVQSLNVTEAELNKFGDSKIVTTSAQNVLEEYLIAHQLLNAEIEGRLIYSSFQQ